MTKRGVKLRRRCSGPFKYPSKDSCYKAPLRMAVNPMSCKTQAGYALPGAQPRTPDPSDHHHLPLPGFSQNCPTESNVPSTARPSTYTQLWPEVRLHFCLLPRLRDRVLQGQEVAQFASPYFPVFTLGVGGWRRTLRLAFTCDSCLPAPICPRTLAQCRLLPERLLSLSVCASSQKHVSSLSQSPASPRSYL